MTQNMLALAVRPLDVATPLLQARQIQKAETETQQAQFNLRQQALGSEARGLMPYVDQPDFATRWAEATDRLAQAGHLDPASHQRIRNSPSALALQQLIAQTSSADQYLKLQELKQSQSASANFAATMSRLANPAAAAVPTTAAPVPANDPTMTVTPAQVAAANGQPAPAAPVAPPQPITWGDGTTQVPPAQQPAQAAPGAPAPVGAPAPQPAQAAPGTPPVRSVNPATGKLDAIVGALSLRGLPKPQFELGMEFLKRELENTKLTDTQREYYNSYVPQELSAGRQPKPFNEYDLERRRATAPPKAESEYDKQMAKVFTEYNQESIKGASTARTQIGSLNRLQQLLSSPNVYQGSGGNFVANLKRIGASVGIDTSSIKDGAANADAIRSIANQFSLQLRNPAGGAGMPGAMSDKDREFLQSMVAGLTGTPGGNTLIIDYMKRVAQRSIDVETQRQKFIQRHGRLNEQFFSELAQWSEQNPLFSEQDMAAATKNQSEPTQGGTTSTRVPWRLGQ